MSEPLKPKIVFDDDTSIENSEILSNKYVFTAEEAESFISSRDDLDSDQEEGRIEGLVQQALKPKRSLWQKLVFISVGLFIASAIAQGIIWISNAWLQSDWVALTASLAGGLIIIAGVGSIYTELRHLYRLRERAEERDQAKLLLTSHNLHQGKIFCNKLAQQARLDSTSAALQRWQASLQETHNDREVVTLYAKIVQPVLDEKAKHLISRYAAESTLMIAISPLALVDMAFIAWRNIKLINKIAEIYGIKLGYFSRIRLFKLVLLNIAFAGMTELIREVGMDWMSQDLLAKLSTRAAQGVGAGLLTARLGIKAMELCRPLPWVDGDKPKLGDFRNELVGLLKKTANNKK